MGDQTCAGKTSRTSAGNSDFNVFHFPTGDLARVDQAGGSDDRRAVLVIVEDRNVEIVTQTAFNDEAFRRLDVLQIDATKSRADIADRGDELLDLFRRDFDVDRIHIRETFEKDRLALHNRLRRHRAKITQTQNGRAVGNHGNHIAFGGIVVSEVFILGDGQNRHSNARRISERQIALGRHWLGCDDGKLSRNRIFVES